MFLPRVPYGYFKGVILVCALLVVTVLSLIHRAYDTPPTANKLPEGGTQHWHDYNGTAPLAQSDEIRHLQSLVQKHDLTKQVTWFARRVQPKYSARKRLSMTESTLQFAPDDFARARVDDEGLRLEPSEKTLKLEASRSSKPDEIDASALLFGISSSYSRVVYSDYAMIQDWARWLTDGKRTSNGARLVLALQDADRSEVEHVGQMLRVAGISASVLSSQERQDTGARYLDLLGALMRQASGDDTTTEFLALVDDDVFFPSLSRLLRKLRKLESEKAYYVGVPSERSDWAVENTIPMTYGGGAVFLSRSMAQQLSELSCLKETGRTEDTESGDQWDAELHKCISQNTDAKLHVLPSFYSPQDDLIYGRQGITYDGYGGGIQPLALHHYRNWHRFEAGRAHLVASACGEDCFLQRYLFGDGWVLVNGYTIAQYPDGVEAMALSNGGSSPVLAQQQSRDADGSPAAADRLVIENDRERTADMKVVAWRGRKRTWRLLDSWVADDGEVWQAYVRRKEGGNSYGDGDDRVPGDDVHAEEEKTDVDSVIFLIW
ncbi:Glycosyltransferase family 31 protein [Pleurostoma richardsiae]|uniref:Glycosyltransferase family 31 protein n=1 Tax=Pleurostoma richardsiae TaxID=41990 RepID=A0AA38R657_9PEZI|nr:Glycosyltransferase family 31 protein [Pleurostoma richardsiae]